MLRSLNSGVTGLINHQTRMDVIGNNISNVNTIGYKQRRLTFGESFSQMVKGATRTESKAGGTNPMQIGLGVQVSSVDMITGQGNLTNTGRTFDLAIDGNAFFGVSDGTATYYTRNGAFQLDSEGYIVIPTNGMVLQGRMADSFGNFPPGTAIGNMQIPMSQQAPAKATTQVDFMRNLPMDGDAKGNVQYTQRFLHAADTTRAAATNGITDPGRDLATPLSSLFNSNGDYLNIKEGDVISISWYNVASIIPGVTEKAGDFNFIVEKPPVNASGVVEDWGSTTNNPSANWDRSASAPAKVYTLDDLLAAMEIAINSAVDTPNAVSLTLNGDGSIGFTNDGTVPYNANTHTPGTKNDSIFSFQVTSTNPESQSPLGKAFNFGSYIGPAIPGTTYETSGNSLPVTISAPRLVNGIPVNDDDLGNPGVFLPLFRVVTEAELPGQGGWYIAIETDGSDSPGAIPISPNSDLTDPTNHAGGRVVDWITNTIPPQPVLSDRLLRPAEQFDKLANVRNTNGEQLGLEDGDAITFDGSVGKDKIQSKPLIYNGGTTLFDDLISKLRNDFMLPAEYIDRDGTVLPTVSIYMNSNNPTDDPMFGTLVVRSMKGKDFSINNLVTNATNSNTNGVTPNNFKTNMGMISKEPARDYASFDMPIDVFDDGGTAHTLTITFTHTGRDGEWEWRASFPGSEYIEPGTGTGKLFFGRDNTVSSWLYDGGGSQLIVDPRNGSGTMRINLNAGSPGDNRGLTQYDTDFTASFRGQDGYTTGALVEVSINSFGLVEGQFSNGTSRAIGQIMVVDFANPAGLIDLADCIFTTSANSGDPVWGRPVTQSSSELKPGSLEMSNVDLGMEFTNMITTQRGYQANSRIVTVSDSMLEELVNLKR